MQEAELIDDDVVIFEIKQGSDWSLQTEEEVARAEKYKCAFCNESKKQLYLCECLQVYIISFLTLKINLIFFAFARADEAKFQNGSSLNFPSPLMILSGLSPPLLCQPLSILTMNLRSSS